MFLGSRSRRSGSEAIMRSSHRTRSPALEREAPDRAEHLPLLQEYGNAFAAEQLRSAGRSLDDPGPPAGAPDPADAGLPAEIRDRFERSLGTDLGDVRVHTGDRAATTADALDARAFTLGRDIYWGPGEPSPFGPAGAGLLAHEVAHAAQQPKGAPPQRPRVGDGAEPAERGAERAASAMLRGEPAAVEADSAPVIRRQQRGQPDAGPTGAVPGTGPASPSGALRRDMFSVRNARPVFGGTLRVERDQNGYLIYNNEITANPQVDLLPHVTLGPDRTIHVGPIQTVVQSTQIGVFRRGGPGGPVVAERRTSYRDARDTPDEGGRANGATPAARPFYSGPYGLMDGHRSTTYQFFDGPIMGMPERMGDGVLTETRGSDSFVLSVGAQLGNEVIHLESFDWVANWNIADVNAPGAQPSAATVAPRADGIAAYGTAANLENPRHRVYAFRSVADALTAPTDALLQYLPSTMREDPAAGRIIAEALRTRNPTFRLGLWVQSAADFDGTDEVEVRIRGHRDLNLGTFSIAERSRLMSGGSSGVLFRFNQVIDPERVTDASALLIFAQDRGTIGHGEQRYTWSWPLVGVTDARMSGAGNGADGEYHLHLSSW
jgi:hypothetical protein